MKKKIGYLVYIFAFVNILFLLLATVLVYPQMIKAYEISTGSGAGYTTGLLIVWVIFIVASYLLVRFGKKLIKADDNLLEKQSEV